METAGVEPAPARTVASTLMLVLSVIGALMVILSPCAIELTTYYTGIIAGVVSSAAIAERGATCRLAVRARILRNLVRVRRRIHDSLHGQRGYCRLMGQQLLRMQAKLRPASTQGVISACHRDAAAGMQRLAVRAATNGHTAVKRRVSGAWAHYANWLGAAFLVFFALKSVGVLKRGGQCFVWLAQFGRKFAWGSRAVVGLVSPKRAAVIRAPGLSLRQPGNITPLNSFCAGLGFP